jgi:SNF2 family DNA or RNA helicase
MQSAAEQAQARARVVRSGNKHKVEIISFYIKDSIERHTAKIQDAKIKKARGAALPTVRSATVQEP